jgi:hypothetical protein
MPMKRPFDVSKKMTVTISCDVTVIQEPTYNSI